jgi:hypothetical protein
MNTKQRKIGGFLMILIGSFLLWFVSKYKDVYEDRAVIKVVWTNIPNNIELKEEATQITFNARIKDRGFSLLWRKIFSKALELDFNQSTFQRNDSVFFNPRTNLERLKDEQREIDLVSASRATIFVPVNRIETKKVPLVKNFDIDYQANFQPVNILGFQPDSVNIYGNSAQLSKIENLKITRPAVMVKDSMTKVNISLSKSFKDLVFDVSTVDYVIEAAQMTEGTVTLPINLINVPENTNVKLLPEMVTLTYTTTVKEFKYIDEEDFTVTIDYSKVKGNNVTVVPDVSLSSNSIKSVRLDNEFVQVLTIL